MTHADQLGLIIGGFVLASIAAGIAAYFHDTKKTVSGSRPESMLDPSLKNLAKWSKKLGVPFDPKDPNDPMAALIAAGEYFRLPGCEPGGPHYEETFQRVLTMMEHMVPSDRLEFWTEQAHRLYGSKYLIRQFKKK